MATKRAVSVTLAADNVLWLKGRAAAGAQSVSELLDRLVTGARQSGQVGPSRSVIGTIDVDRTDPGLEHADRHVRAIFDRALGRPLRAKAFPFGDRVRRRGARRRG